MLIDMDEATEKKRYERLIFKKAVISQNNFGKRLAWIREKLCLSTAKKEYTLSTSQIAKDIDMPRSTLSDWEAGIRTSFWEEFTCATHYANKLWQLKFKGNYPVYEGVEIKEITEDFIRYGKKINSFEEAMEIKQATDEARKYAEREIEYRLQMQEEEKAQLSMFLAG